MASKLRIAVLGSSGSIGVQTLDVVRQHADKLEVVALALGTRTEVLVQQAKEFNVKHIVVGDESLQHTSQVDMLIEHLKQFPKEATSLGFGSEDLANLVRLPEVDLVVNALVGAAGLAASLATLEAGKKLALANKESLVVGGDLIMPLATHDTLLPIDSEHGAIYQCLLGEKCDEVTRLWLTASGGPFYGQTRDQLKTITPEQALAHPTWNMGAKITIDSSTLMNKGLEVIEAHHLFGVTYDQIEVVVQRQSAIHSMVEFSDGSVKAHLGTTDMRIPIQFALSYPERWEAPVQPLDFREVGSLDFGAPDPDTFRCLDLAMQAGRQGGTLPCVMNAANEVAVAAFLKKEGSYLQIADCVEATMEAHKVESVQTLEQLESIDGWARAHAIAYLK